MRHPSWFSSWIQSGPRQLSGKRARTQCRSLARLLAGKRDELAKDTKGKKVKVEGCKSYAEKDPATVELAKKLHRYPINGRRRSLRQVAAELAAAGCVVREGKPYEAAAIKRMIGA
jgi:hypothetical protein